MPELPEVETTRRGIEPLVSGRRIARVDVRAPKLRWPIDPDLPGKLNGQMIHSVGRRAKYLIFYLDTGCLLLHLGMTGHLRVVSAATPYGKHDHVDIHLSGGQSLRFTDPRRFGALLWCALPPEEHPLLSRLGPEPLSGEFNGDYLYRRSRGRRLAVKPYIMDQQVVVGVGNIYASEALFRARVRPDRSAGRISLQRYTRIAAEIKAVLRAAVDAGGTTFSDFRRVDGRPGYFKQKLQVYGREGQPCPRCGAEIAVIRLGQRSTFYCRQCQN